MSNVYNNKEFKKISGFLRTIFSGECEMCNKIKSKIEIHHNDHNRANNTIFNLFHLCEDCHLIANNSRLNTEIHMLKVIYFTEVYLNKLRSKADKVSLKNPKVQPFGHPLSDD